MKLYHSFFIYTVTFIFLTNNCFSISFNTIKSKVEPAPSPNIVLPDSMKDNGTREQTITFPDPKQCAFILLSLYYDMETYKCEVGVENGNVVRNLVNDFMATVKPTNKSTPAQVEENKKQLSASLLAIRNSFESVYNSKCAAFLKAEMKRWRRQVFLFSLRYR